MFYVLAFTLILLWSISTAKRVLHHFSIWQSKEFRFDRVLSYLFEDRLVNKIKFVDWVKYLSLVFLLVYILLGRVDVLSLIPGQLLVAVYILEVVGFVRDFLAHKVERPRITLKIIVLIGLTLALQVSFVVLELLRVKELLNADGLFSNSWMVNSLSAGTAFFYVCSFFCLIADVLLPFQIFFTVLLLGPPNWLGRSYKMKRAKEKIQRMKNLRVIGITGSYGKSSTKEFLYTILSSKFNVIRTEGTINTDIGVAQTILGKLKPEHEIFIVEMGAYKRGEIRKICEVVKPTMAILTAVAEQHLSLFGSFESIVETKYELIESLPRDGVAVFNLDNRWTKWLAERAENPSTPLRLAPLAQGRSGQGPSARFPRPFGSAQGSGQAGPGGKRVWRYSVSEQEGGERFVYVQNISQEGVKITFDVVYRGEKEKFSVNVLGRHNVLNILAAACVALELGLSLKDVAKAARKIVPPDRTLKVLKGKNDITVLDDQGNVSPAGFKAALEALKDFKGNKKVVVTPGMIELGEASEVAHEKVGKLIDEICDFAVITKKDKSPLFTKGVDDKKKFVVEEDRDDIVRILGTVLEEGDVVLLEGRIIKGVKERLLER